jgi:hypothetical protein
MERKKKKKKKEERRKKEEGRRRRNGAKTISLQKLFGRLNYKPHAKIYSNLSMFTEVIA